MSRLEVQGIVSSSDDLPYVQIRQLDDLGENLGGAQLSVIDAREHAFTILEAATNAVYEAALLDWCKSRDPKDGEAMAMVLIDGVRKHRSDHWGFPDKPEDWRNETTGKEEPSIEE